jgi:hypothetical protein
MSDLLRRVEIPLAISSIITIIILIDTFSGVAAIRTVSTTLQSWAIILAGFALGLGALNLIGRQIRQLQRREMIIRSAGTLLLLVVVIITGLADLTLQHPVYRFITDNAYSKLYGTGWSFQYFFLFFGMYRAYRVRNIDSFFMFLASVLLILKSGTIFQAFLGPNAVVPGQWILDVPSKAGQRAIIIASALGIISIGFRVLTGKERGYIRAGGS